jgi:hypothetical protein
MQIVTSPCNSAQRPRHPAILPAHARQVRAEMLVKPTSPSPSVSKLTPSHRPPPPDTHITTTTPTNPTVKTSQNKPNAPIACLRFSLACCAPQSTPRHDDEISCRVPDPCAHRLGRIRYGAELTRLPLTSHLLLVCQGVGTRRTKQRERDV